MFGWYNKRTGNQNQDKRRTLANLTASPFDRSVVQVVAAYVSKAVAWLQTKKFSSLGKIKKLLSKTGCRLGDLCQGSKTGGDGGSAR